MRVGIHLPQFGRAVATGGIQRAAVRAEDLGFADVWVSDHQVVPASQPYPVPYIYEPLQALAFAAAVTDRVGLGTSVLVATQYTSPLALANALASLDHLSGGRLVLGAGIGWSAPEYAALGASFRDRGERLEEIIALCRIAWTEDPATHEGRFYPFRDIRLLPKPAHRIPIWLGGASALAVERAVRIADGYHALDLDPAAAAAMVGRLRAARPEDSFTVSMRLSWSPDDDDGAVRARADAYRDAGIDHLTVTPVGGDIDSWLGFTDRIAGQFLIP